MFNGCMRIAIVGSGEVGKNVYRTLFPKLSSAVTLRIFDSNMARSGVTVEGVIVAPLAELNEFNPCVVIAGFSGTDAAYNEWKISIREEFGFSVVTAMEVFKCYPEMRGWPLMSANDAVARVEEATEIEGKLSDETSKEQFRAYFKWVCREDGVQPRDGIGSDQYVNALTVQQLVGSCVLDGGAYSGDTLKQFIDHVGLQFEEYHAFEPDPANFARLSDYVSSLPGKIREKCNIYQEALSKESGFVSFETENNQMSRVSEGGGGSTRCVSLVDLASDRGIRPTFIKLDLEGSERAVLTAGMSVIRSWRPTLCVAIYHNPTDFIEIPLLMMSELHDYRFYVRAHNRFGLDFVFYAVPN